MLNNSFSKDLMSTDVRETGLQSLNPVMLFVLGPGAWKDPLGKMKDADPELRRSRDVLLTFFFIGLF